MKIITKTLALITIYGLSSFALALNINTADAETMSQELKGIGMVKAEAIVNFRTEHGPFSQPNDLIAVPGIGPKILESIQDQLTFEDTEEELSNNVISN